ncbi:hypothetical protein ABE530_04180 [Brucella sp. TWI559]
MALIALIPPWLKTALITVLTGGAIAAFSFGFGYYRGDHSGFQRAKTAQLKADMKAERERTKDDAKLRGLSDYDFCIVALRRRGLPADECVGLRGVSSE